MTTQSDSANVEAQTIAARTEWSVAGGFFKLLSSSSAVVLELYRNGRRVLFANSAPSGFYQVIDFDKVVITPAGATALSFIAAPDQGGIDSVTLTGTGSGHVNSLKTATNASTQCLAANASRRYLQVQVPSAAAAGIRIRTDGGAAADDASSIEILPGQSYAPLVAPTGQINMIRKGAANIDFNVTEA